MQQKKHMFEYLKVLHQRLKITRPTEHEIYPMHENIGYNDVEQGVESEGCECCERPECFDTLEDRFEHATNTVHRG